MNFPDARSVLHPDELASDGLRGQSRELRTRSLFMIAYGVQQDVAPLSPERRAWIGGHGTEP